MWIEVGEPWREGSPQDYPGSSDEGWAKVAAVGKEGRKEGSGAQVFSLGDGAEPGARREEMDGQAGLRRHCLRNVGVLSLPSFPSLL